ncbi:MAG: regulator [Rhodospirillales bacterium]|nr:regulator [Rhodospirillales bacterium]
MTFRKAPATKRMPSRPITATSLENVATHYLERFAASTADLRRVLLRRVRRAAEDDDRTVAEARRSDGAALVEALIAKLQSAGILDDRRYAEIKAASLHRRGGSRRAVAARLAQHGVERELITHAIGAIDEDGGDTDLIAAVAFARRRRLGPYRAGDAAPARPKDMAALARAGFDQNTARRVLDCRDPAAVELLLRCQDDDTV